MDIDDHIMDDLVKLTGERKKSPAVAKAVDEFVKRRKAREFGRILRAGLLDYPMTNDEIEALDR